MTEKLRCSFCGVSQDDCDVLVVGDAPGEEVPAAAICGDCIRHSAQVLVERTVRRLLGQKHRADHPKRIEVRR
ncbi:MAG: hypothetical protein IPK85_01760 [Gemmatimonadetes bacterium]|nr:hypothetical protein [Gemmatimonadota bacterium]